MKIAFLHRSYVAYTVDTPYSRPVGGTESALSYLAVELAKLGHDVTILTSTKEPGRYRNVECLNYQESLTSELFNSFDILVVSNEACGRELQDRFGSRTPLVLWIQHADDQPSIEDLQYTRERKIWSGLAFVSQWQLEQFYDYYWIPREKSRVMRNAISPLFADLPESEPWFSRGEAPILVYTSMPYRGLDVLLDSFPTIRKAVPGTRLKVFSSMARVQLSAEKDEYTDLYERCISTEGVEYVGSVGQTELASELRNAAALAYPSTFFETSCIAAMEAMSVGAAVLTTRTGALPETTAGFGRMIEFQTDKRKLAEDFANLTIDALTEMTREPAQAAARRAAQVAHMRKNAVWPVRALEWEAWLRELAGRDR